MTDMPEVFAFHPIFGGTPEMDAAGARVFVRRGNGYRFCLSLGYHGNGISWDAEKENRATIESLAKYRADPRWIEETDIDVLKGYAAIIDNRTARRALREEKYA